MSCVVSHDLHSMHSTFSYFFSCSFSFFLAFHLFFFFSLFLVLFFFHSTFSQATASTAGVPFPGRGTGVTQNCTGREGQGGVKNGRGRGSEKERNHFLFHPPPQLLPCPTPSTKRGLPGIEWECLQCMPQICRGRDCHVISSAPNR